MQYIINGVEVKVGQIWEQRNGRRCVISRIGHDSGNPCFPIEWVSVSSDYCGSVNEHGQECYIEETYSDLTRCISEPNSSINQSKEQNMQNTTTFITDLRNEEPENTKCETWGDLPDGTAVLDEFGELFIVNKYADIAAVSIDGNYVRGKRDTLQGCTQVQIEIQIKKTIRKL